MKEFFVGISVFVAVMIVILGITWLAEGNNFFLYKYFAPRKAEVQRQVFEETASYVRGNIQELEKQHLEYIKATPEQRRAMKPIILQEVNGINQDNLSPDLKSWINSLKNEL
jgi:hypothetical protein